MPSFLADTNVLVAAALAGHPDHAAARAELIRRRERGEEMVLSAHSLVECYSILTRMPPPNRFAPAAAIQTIQRNYVEGGTVIALTVDQVITLLASVPARGIVGGRVYDAVIAEVAEVARVDELLTFNVRDFAPLTTIARVAIPREA